MLPILREEIGMEQRDLAFLLMSNAGNLSKIENGLRVPSLNIIISYHILFGAPLKMMFPDVYADQRAQIIERSQRLISILKRTKSPKSFYRLKCVEKIVKTLTRDDHERGD